MNLEDALKEGKSITLDIEVIRKDGTREVIPNAAQLIKDESGKYVQTTFPGLSAGINIES